MCASVCVLLCGCTALCGAPVCASVCAYVFALLCVCACVCLPLCVCLFVCLCMRERVFTCIYIFDSFHVLRTIFPSILSTIWLKKASPPFLSSHCLRTSIASYLLFSIDSYVLRLPLQGHARSPFHSSFSSVLSVCSLCDLSFTFCISVFIVIFCLHARPCFSLIKGIYMCVCVCRCVCVAVCVCVCVQCRACVTN